jgi:hypothetical protein
MYCNGLEWSDSQRNRSGDFHHPLCEMPADMIYETCALHNRTCKHMYLLWDGQTSANDFIDRGAVVCSKVWAAVSGTITHDFVNALVRNETSSSSSRSLSSTTLQRQRRRLYYKRKAWHRHINEEGLAATYLDMLVGLHSDLLVMNPLSTMTWPIRGNPALHFFVQTV